MSFIGNAINLAYIDPGSGAMLLQWFIAAIVGAGFFFRQAVTRLVRRLFGKKKDIKDEKPLEPDDPR